jgi:hypothetical protein
MVPFPSTPTVRCVPRSSRAGHAAPRWPSRCGGSCSERSLVCPYSTFRARPTQTRLWSLHKSGPSTPRRIDRFLLSARLPHDSESPCAGIRSVPGPCELPPALTRLASAGRAPPATPSADRPRSERPVPAGSFRREAERPGGACQGIRPRGHGGWQSHGRSEPSVGEVGSGLVPCPGRSL